VRSPILKKFVENWTIVKELLERENPALVERLTDVYNCITANDVKNRNEYEKLCGDRMPWAEFESYVISYAYGIKRREGQKTYARTEQKTRVAVESAVGEIIQSVASQVGKTSEWIAAFVSELIKLVTPLGLRVLQERGLGQEVLANLAPEDAARKVAEALYAVWELKAHEDKVVKELGELRAELDELRAVNELYKAMLDVALAQTSATLSEVVKSLAEVAGYKNPQVAALLAALEE
jgi:hypothetical protein